MAEQRLTKIGNRGGSSCQRESNLELFRIITMMLIVAHHYVVNSGLTSSDSPLYENALSGKSLFLLIFGAWGKIGINCFVMITGYFMCKSKITVKKFAKLIGEWLFYRYIIYLIFLISGYEPFSVKNLITAIIPIYKVSQNFTSCFVLFWLCIPFLNLLIEHMNERQHIRLILLMSFIYILFGTMHTVTMNYVSWFCVLYFIASYIRIYPKKLFQNLKICSILLLIVMILDIASVVCCTWIGTKIGKNSPFFFVTDSNTILAVLTGIFAFLVFRNMKIPYSKFINTVSASTFGVLCIHANSDTMRKWLWKDILDNFGNYHSDFMVIHAIGSVLGIFTVCVLLDMLRIRLIEKPFFIFWDKHWESFSDKWSKKENIIFEKLNVD